MNTSAKEHLWALSEKEKQTLRLIVRGHDAKSVARNLGLSVYTINERLRDARRKMAVSSSREAARILLEAERSEVVSLTPNFLGDTRIGEDTTLYLEEQGIAPIDGVGWAHRLPSVIIGVFLMTLALSLLVLSLATQSPYPSTSAATASAITAPNSEVADTALHWLVLLDQSRWDESYQATGTAFRKLNTVQAWAAASENARVPLGAMISRTFLSEEDLPAPPHGYEVIKFRTRFANKPEAVETVTLDREGGSWRVVGVTIG